MWLLLLLGGSDNLEPHEQEHGDLEHFPRQLASSYPQDTHPALPPTWHYRHMWRREQG
jgi:hypothetical protein